MIREPHPFARFVNILGRGKSLTRALTQDEARAAMGMILDGEVLPEQLGAFLMLLRIKEETGAEIAGFVEAARARFHRPDDAPPVDLDWPSYAGKSRQSPWYILAALALADEGVRVLMHGLSGHGAGRVYSTDALASLGVPLARDGQEAAAQLARSNFAWLPLEAINAMLADMMGLRPVLGLRSCVHTLARALDPFGATASLIGIFHPGYMDIHRDAALALDAGRALIFRGDGGEGERRPNKPCEIYLAADGACETARWPAMMKDSTQAAEGAIDLGRLGALWRGESVDDYGEGAVIGTIALALKATGREQDVDQAQNRAQDIWRARDVRRLRAA